jgi:hypothetical protein
MDLTTSTTSTDHPPGSCSWQHDKPKQPFNGDSSSGKTLDSQDDITTFIEVCKLTCIFLDEQKQARVVQRMLDRGLSQLKSELSQPGTELGILIEKFMQGCELLHNCDLLNKQQKDHIIQCMIFHIYLMLDNKPDVTIEDHLAVCKQLRNCTLLREQEQADVTRYAISEIHSILEDELRNGLSQLEDEPAITVAEYIDKCKQLHDDIFPQKQAQAGIVRCMMNSVQHILNDATDISIEAYILTFRLTGRYQNIRRSSVKREEWPRNEERKVDERITLKQVEAL